MKIGVDLDEITAEFIESLLDFYEHKTGKKFFEKQFKTYNFWETLGGDLAEAIEMINEFYNSTYFDEIKPVKGAINSYEVMSRNNKLFVITSRPPAFKTKTDEWFKKYFDFPVDIRYASDFYKGNGNTKAEICKELGISVMIEDMPTTAIDCADNNINVILFDKPWNQDINHCNIQRVNGWEYATKIIFNFNSQYL